MNQMMRFGREALRYIDDLHWHVFPLADGTKVPAIEGGHGVKDASCYAEDIMAWAKRFPKANIGIACGTPSGIVVLDIDPRNGGNDSLARLAKKGCVLPPGPRARTGNNGLHFFFRYHPGVTNSKKRFGEGIDVKSTGGYVVGAPSFTAPSRDGPGGHYTWEVSPFGTPVPRLPIWAITVLCPPARPAPPNGGQNANFSGAEGIESLARFVSKSSSGQRNDRLYWAACRARDLVNQRRVHEHAAIHGLTQAAAVCGLVQAEAIKTIMSAFKPRG